MDFLDVKKLLGITEASIQFYGKTSEFESAIRRGTTNLNLEEYIELMNGLKDAIKFFGSHSSYRGQLEAMVIVVLDTLNTRFFQKESFDNGCGFLETEFNNCVRFESVVLDPVKIADCLDENYGYLLACVWFNFYFRNSVFSLAKQLDHF